MNKALGYGRACAVWLVVGWLVAPATELSAAPLTPSATADGPVASAIGGRPNFALTNFGGTTFSSSDLNAAYAAPRANDGVINHSGNSWIPASTASNEFIAVKFATPIIAQAVVWHGQTGYNGRSAGLWSLQYTRAPNPSATSSWTEIGTYTYNEPGCASPMPRSYFSFSPVTNVTALRLVLLNAVCGIQLAVQEFEVYEPNFPPPAGQAGQFALTEFMAANDTTLNDEDGDNSDWIEIHNEGDTSADLAGWYLTDSASNLRKWQFPSTNIARGAYLIVFASEKNRRTPGAPLHTSFKLSGSGEYLALVRPDGTNIATEFAPAYPQQVGDISYGVVRTPAPINLIPFPAPARAHVPANNAMGLAWTSVEFDDSGWTNGVTGLGYDRITLGVNYLPLIGLNVEQMMYNVNPTIYSRLNFNVARPQDLTALTLRMRFEDGFIAYLNGQEVARNNAPANATWNSSAVLPRADIDATNYVDVNLSDYRTALFHGSNVLAFHGLNIPVNSPAFLLVPELSGVTLNGPRESRYFTSPTPGLPNHGGVTVLGPLISSEAHTPVQPLDNDNVTVTARVRPTFAPVNTVTVRYRTMWDAEVSTTMFDDGAHGDGAAGDGVFGATIPASAAAPGQMLRWVFAATDNSGNSTRYPLFADADSPAYFGTVVAHPELTNALPVFHWFVQTPAEADTTAGTRCAVFYNGEFYDNVFCRLRGASAPFFPKKPYKFDFNPGYHFRYAPGLPRVDEINLNTTYQDKTHVRAPLSFETYRSAGVTACDAFNVRVQQNNAFYSVAVMVEQVDDTFLEKRGLDENGALYKIFNGINSAVSGVEKKTRRTENNNDLQALVSAVDLNNTNRSRAIFDLLDLPQIVNYLAAGIVAQDWDRAIKNIYVYRDTEGTGQWQLFPWDKDLSFGKAALASDVVVANKDGGPKVGDAENSVSHPFYGIVEANCCGANNLFEAVLKTGATREMFLRRLRTLMDELLQPPGTLANELRYEARLDELYVQLEKDAALDLAKWGAGYGSVQNLATAMNALRTQYLAPRRTHLYQTHGMDNVGAYVHAIGIPYAQVANPILNFGSVEASPASGNQDQEFVELINPGALAADISGWRIEGAIDFTFAPGTVVPGGSRVFVSPNIQAFQARTAGPRGGQGLFVVGHYRGELSARGETLRLLNRTDTLIATQSFAAAPSLTQQYLRITELMYHPAAVTGNTNDSEEFEFIELRNSSTLEALDLRGVRFANGVQFDFTLGSITNLPPGAHVLVVKNAAAFGERYGAALPVAGAYVGSLDNAGERIELLDAAGEEILDFSFDDDWYPITDGHGFSLAVVNENAAPDSWNDQAQWRPGGTLHGTPGGTDVFAAHPPILVTELLSRADVQPPVDSVELFNPNGDPIDISGWFLTDNFNAPTKYRIPNGTILPALSYLVLDESHFNSTPGTGNSFAFSSTGEEVFLFSANALGHLTGYMHGFKFGAALDGVSFGRHLTSAAEEHFVAQTTRTLGGANSGPRVGPLVFSEIMYHPPDSPPFDGSRDEFIEIQNISANAVTLSQPTRPTNVWRLDGGVRLDFPSNLVIAAGGHLLVVNFDPADDDAAAGFRAAYGLAPDVTLVGPYAGRLSDSGDLVQLLQPDVLTNDIVVHVLVDDVRFNDRSPWPTAADGDGSSLQRTMNSEYGNDPANWFAAGRTPGATNIFNLEPNVVMTSPTNGSAYPPRATVVVSADAADIDGTISTVEFYAGSQKLGEKTTPPFTLTWPAVPGGVHILRAVATDNRLSRRISELVTISVGPVETASTPLVSAGTVWKFSDRGTNLGTAWRQPGYDEATWFSGPAQLGYGDGDEATVVSFGPTATNKHVTTYFRQSFTIPDHTAFTALNLRVLRDDGAVVYLNGTEIHRTGMPEGTIAFNTLANVVAAGADELNNFYHVTLPSDLLVNGVNIVAAEVHQSAVNSSDLSFDLSLTGIQASRAPYISVQPASVFATPDDTVILSVLAGGTVPLTYQWRRYGTNLPGATGSSLTLQNVEAAHSGPYSVFIQNEAGTVLSRDALVVVSEESDYAAAVLADAPIHYYRFDETATSQPAFDSGNPGGANGTYTGGIALQQSTTPLAFQPAARFDGNNGTFVDLGVFHPGNSISAEAWIKLDADARAGSFHAVIARWDGSYELDIATDERPNFVIRNQAGAFGIVAGPDALPRGQWHHLVGIYDANTLSIFVNGRLGATVSVPGTLRNGGPVPDRVMIGATRDGFAQGLNFKGLIDEVAIYNRALSAERILAHYRAGAPTASLTITAEGVIRWPAYPSDLVLQYADNLGSTWQNSSWPREQEGHFYKVTVPLTSTNQFFRLFRP